MFTFLTKLSLAVYQHVSDVVDSLFSKYETRKAQEEQKATTDDFDDTLTAESTEKHLFDEIIDVSIQVILPSIVLGTLRGVLDVMGLKYTIVDGLVDYL